MSKTQVIAMSAVLLLLPGLFLAYVLVMMFVQHADSVTTMMQVVAGIGLIASTTAILYPLLCIFLAPAIEKKPKPEDDQAGLEESDEPEAETFESDDELGEDWDEESDAAISAEEMESAPSTEFETVEFETSDFDDADEEFEPSGGLDGSVDLDSDIFLDDLESAEEMPASPSGDFETIEFETDDDDDFEMFDDE